MEIRRKKRVRQEKQKTLRGRKRLCGEMLGGC